MVKWIQRLTKLFGSDDDHAPTEDVESVRNRYVLSMENSEEPWALFEIVGFENDGQVKVQFSWNQAFISKLRSIGYDAEVEEELVQLFFFTSMMSPGKGLDVPVSPDAHPRLSSETSILKM